MGTETFRVIARAIIVTSDRRVVMATSRDGRALVLPGGAVDPGESLPEAALRETKEECGVEVTIGPAIWVREFIDRREANLEVYFLAHPAGDATLPDHWQHADQGQSALTRRIRLYSREDLKTIDTPVYPIEMRDAFWAGLSRGFVDGYLGRFEG
jgi:8-oxo-dGTP pyrophosphatase MutT (NUDIX family)